MLITTTQSVEGHRILEYKGIVTGETIIGANFWKDFKASIRDIVGGRSGSYEKVLIEARETSLNEMAQRAASWGANAIIGVVFTTTLRIIHFLNEFLPVIILKNRNAIFPQIPDKSFLAHPCNLCTVA